MRRIQPHLGLASGVQISNVWLLTTPSGRRLLFDTGHWIERPALRLHLWRAGIRRRGDLDGVILTHRHSDHAGNAAWLRRTFDAPIYAHEEDAPYLSGEARAPRLARRETVWWARALCRFEDHLPARTPIDDTFSDGLWKHGLYVHHVPGHTEGSVLLHHEPTSTLLSGDSILAGVALMRWMEAVRFAKRDFSDELVRSVDNVREALRELPPVSTLAAGHGPAITRETQDKLHRLLNHPRPPRARIRLR